MQGLGRTLAVVLASMVVGACSYVTPDKPLPPHAPNRVAYVADDNHIYTRLVDGSGDARRVDIMPDESARANEMRISRWPTWSPDGSRLAFVRLRSGEGSAPAHAAVWTSLPEGGDLKKVWESQSLAPIYMSWAPNGGSLALLAQDNQELALITVDPSGGRPARAVARGGPLYLSWAPTGAEMLIHVTSGDRSRLDVVGMGPSDSTRTLGSAPSDFRAPMWSPDGKRVAFVEKGPDKSALLTVADVDGGNAVRIASLTDEVAFVWAPDGERLAFSVRGSSEQVFYRGIETVKADGSARAQVTTEPVMSFFWSPDGGRLAYAVADRQAEALVWTVADPAGKGVKKVGAFLPSQEQIRHLAFFDQYAQSHAVWSPDGKYLVYSGVPAGTPEGQRRTRVYAAPADGSAEPRVIADGIVGLLPARAGVAR
jgi:TolB protein